MASSQAIGGIEQCHRAVSNNAISGLQSFHQWHQAKPPAA
jgi:hypothetical protein